MGACTFFKKSAGENANAAFQSAVSEARYWHGHSGYTGTIAEKSSFSMIQVPANPYPTLNEAQEYAEELIDKRDPRIDDKWGPAGCIKLSEGSFFFFGWASE